ncbi:MAG: hypothetical protein IJ060_08420 [Oscillospiraceae bacterium]|nr:hypothetical protein [Oscillospiraceae bacterium]
MSKKKNKNRKPQPQKLDYEAIRERDAERKKKRREKTRDKRRKIMKWVCIPLIAAGVLCAAGFGTYYYLKSSGWFLHHRTAAKTEHYEVTDAMFACYYRQCVDTYLNYCESDAGLTPFDESRPAKEQDYQPGYSFYDFFMDTTADAVEKHLQLCEAAYAEGYTLSEERLAECRRQAEEEDLSRYQKGVTVADIEKAKQISFLSQYFQSDSIAAIEITDEEIDTYFHAHEGDYLTVSICGYTFPYDTDETNAVYGMTQEQAVAYAMELQETKTPEEFYQKIETILADEMGEDEETVQTALDSMKFTNLITYYADDVQEWARRDDAKAGDVFLTNRAEQNIVQVCMLLEKPTYSEEPTADVRIIYLQEAEFDGLENALDFAEELKAECEAGGSQLSDFVEMVNEYSQDVNTYPYGGLISSFTPSRTSYGSELTDWAFDSERTAGDMTVVSTGSGAILAYYEKAGDEIAWRNAVYDTLYAEKKDALSEKNHSAEVTKYPENYKYITG